MGIRGHLPQPISPQQLIPQTSPGFAPKIRAQIQLKGASHQALRLSERTLPNSKLGKTTLSRPMLQFSE